MQSARGALSLRQSSLHILVGEALSRSNEFAGRNRFYTDFAAKFEQSVVASESSICELFVDVALKKKIGLLTQYDSGQFRFVLLEAVPCDLEHSLCSYRSFVWNIAIEVLLGTWT